MSNQYKLDFVNNVGKFLKKNFIENHQNQEVMQESDIKPPRYHSKCRYDPGDKNCANSQYQIENNKNIARFPVRIKEIPWYYDIRKYDPIAVNDNQNINNYEIDTSYHEKHLDELKELLNFNGVINPVGRTGVTGRGSLSKFGPNHTVDILVTRWKRDKKTHKIIKNEKTGLPILEFLAIKKEGSNEWAIPGGNLKPFEPIQEGLLRIFKEQVLTKFSNLKIKTFENKIYAVSRVKDVSYVEGLRTHVGYVDDPRNTDNAWVEAVVYNFHDDRDEFMRKLTIRYENDDEVGKWVEANSKVELYANYAEFLQEISQHYQTNW